MLRLLPHVKHQKATFLVPASAFEDRYHSFMEERDVSGRGMEAKVGVEKL